MNLRHINDYETISYLIFHIYRRSFHLPARLAGQRNTDTSSSGPNNHHHRKVTYMNLPIFIDTGYFESEDDGVLLERSVIFADGTELGFRRYSKEASMASGYEWKILHAYPGSVCHCAVLAGNDGEGAVIGITQFDKMVEFCQKGAYVNCGGNKVAQLLADEMNNELKKINSERDKLEYRIKEIQAHKHLLRLF